MRGFSFRLASTVAAVSSTVVVFSGCASFAMPRSAVVDPGLQMNAQASVSLPPGDDAAWFWSFDCAQDCNHAIPAADVNLTWGSAGGGGKGFALGAGLNGTYPYVEGYWQARGGPSAPFGVGTRVGVPVTSWNEHQVYVRFDRQTEGGRVLFNPALFLHTGNSPNGQNPGRFIGLVFAVGYETGGNKLRYTPGLALIAAHVSRERYGDPIASGVTVFAAASMRLELRP